MAEKKQDGKSYSEAPKVQQIESNETYEHELFTIVNHNGEFMIALGNAVVSKEKFNSREGAAHYIDCKPWELILNATAVMWDRLNALKEQSKS